MKILIINYSDLDGGAARAAYRLHQSLLNEGVDSQMLVIEKSSDDFTVSTASDKLNKTINKFRPNIDAIPLLFYKDRSSSFFSTSWFNSSSIINKINEINPDIVHLHWINKGMIKIEGLPKIKAPIVWTLHDNWAFTGGCHVMWDCKKYQTHCGSCPKLGSVKEKDLSWKIFKRKQKTFSKIQNLTIIGLSKWINNCSRNSTLIKDKKHINLPNPISTERFKPCDKIKARELWNLPKEKKLVLFGAVNGISDINKGYKQLKEAFTKINSKDIELVIFGSTKPKKHQGFKYNVHYLGYLHDDISLVTLYSAVDITIIPSLQENLSNVIMESLACATPVVGFNIGGNGDMIDHKNNGYLAEPFDSSDLANGIEWVLNNNKYHQICLESRKIILKEFDSKIVSKKYIKLYREILDD